MGSLLTRMSMRGLRCRRIRPRGDRKQEALPVVLQFRVVLQQVEVLILFTPKKLLEVNSIEVFRRHYQLQRQSRTDPECRLPTLWNRLASSDERCRPLLKVFSEEEFSSQ